MKLAYVAIALGPAPFALVVTADIRPRVWRHHTSPVPMFKVAEPSVCETALGKDL